MKKNYLFTRRQIILTGLSGIGGLLLPGCSKKLPPTYGNILRMGDVLTYVVHRTLLPGQSMAREYQHSDISSFPATGTTNPADETSKYYSEAWGKFHHGEFANWGLSIEGLVARPGSYSLATLQSFPNRTQITRHTCEEGWTAIAEWTGVPLGYVLQQAGIQPNARFVNCYAYDDYMESIDMLDAFHPQTILAYGMNGRNLPVQHGAPVRLRVEKQIGYKSVKYLKRIVVTDEFVDVGDTGWSWYNGI
ncbi:molybdopterin-dependent oxidoreductase [Flavihumibacter profundi]|uniref:molybdopterin-dependent oxidoreductase n=1 Tax=Flavihumibacter profundi TaxID=2716883 RepID=UPI001CC715A8|nr:molybdopterin-dependent oxidoreductase [Flavihumibacter profundi]MBZ5859589.1 molybdopterin-dependent oxidoreductase [Flavihumibacter profundi]